MSMKFLIDWVICLVKLGNLIFQQLRRQQASKQEKLSRLMRQYDKKVAASHDATDQLKR